MLPTDGEAINEDEEAFNYLQDPLAPVVFYWYDEWPEDCYASIGEQVRVYEDQDGKEEYNGLTFYHMCAFEDADELLEYHVRYCTAVMFAYIIYRPGGRRR